MSESLNLNKPELLALHKSKESITLFDELKKDDEQIKERKREKKEWNIKVIIKIIETSIIPTVIEASRKGEVGCEFEIPIDYFQDETFEELDNANLNKNQYVKEVCRYFTCENVLVKNFYKCIIGNCRYIVFNVNWELSVDEFVNRGDNQRLWDITQKDKSRIIKTFKGLENGKMIKKDNNLFELLNEEYNKNKYKVFERIKKDVYSNIFPKIKNENKMGKKNMVFNIRKDLRKREHVEYIKTLLEKENIYAEFRGNANLYIRWDKSYRAIMEEKKLKKEKKLKEEQNLSVEKSDVKQNAGSDKRDFNYFCSDIINIIRNAMIITIMLVVTGICFWILELLYNMR